MKKIATWLRQHLCSHAWRTLDYIEDNDVPIFKVIRHTCIKCGKTWYEEKHVGESSND